MSTRWPFRRGTRDESGYAVILVAVFAAAVMLPLCALSVDVARMYVEIERVQNAADAAAMAGVTFLPDDLPEAGNAAKAVSARNGYPDSGLSRVAIGLGAKPTQLKVTVSSTITNSFAAAFGIGTTTITRSALADYNGPAPMGSPCNTFGNEPKAGAAETLGTGSQLVVPVGGAPCSTTPKFWGAVAGPETPKANGDGLMTRKCSSGNSGCTGTSNDEFDPLGYFYLVRVGAAAVNKPVSIQIYDPAFVETGDKCEVATKQTDNPSGTKLRDNMNSYTNDGNARYATTAGLFCTGDVLSNDNAEAPITSFVLRRPTDTYRPVNGTPVTGCVKQYKGYKENDNTTSKLRRTRDNNQSNGSYTDEIAKVFHQWVNFCTFTPTQVGDHYLQVRTNVALGGSPDGAGGYSGFAQTYNQMDDNKNVKGDGNNRFALRVTGPHKAAVSIAAWENMGIYANLAGGTTEFNLVRVIPAAASKTLLIKFFDVGDAESAGSIKILPPTDSNLPTPLVGCTGAGVYNGTLTSCQLTGVGSNYNGKSQTIRVPIPPSYNCTSTATGGCWFRLQVAFPSGVSDTTTWSARVEGDPVRLIE